MDDSDKIIERIEYAASSVLGRDVMAMKRTDWLGLIHEDGMPTLMNEAPQPCEGVMHDAMVVAVAASGNANPEPGFDIVRRAFDDDPYIYNIDHYDVCQRIQLNSSYDQIRQTAGVEDSPLLQQVLDDNVFIVKRGPAELSDHWCKELPERINISIHKRTDSQA